MSNLSKILELTSKKDISLIKKIVQRAVKQMIKGGVKIDESVLERVLIMTHGLCCKLELEELLESNEFVFIHDILGLFEHFDEEKLVIRNNFIPRSAKYFTP